MRVSTRLFYQGLQPRIQRLAEELKDKTEKISSGKRINRPSDDPSGIADSIGLRSTLSQLEQYRKNVDTAKAWLSHREAALSGINDLIQRAHEIAVQMANGTQSAEERVNAAKEIGHLLDQAIELGNTEFGGRYIFSGYAMNTKPFSKTTIGGIETAQYLGDTNDFEIQISKDETIVAAKNGQSSLMDTGIFTALGTLKKALEDNDVEAVREQISQLRVAGDAIDNEIADTGAKAYRLEVRANAVADFTAVIEERLSNVEDTDIAQMVIELNERQLAYEAALACIARLQGLTILDYLR